MAGRPLVPEALVMRRHVILKTYVRLQVKNLRLHGVEQYCLASCPASAAGCALRTAGCDLHDLIPFMAYGLFIYNPARP
jgi:hypothetical protein